MNLRWGTRGVPEVKRAATPKHVLDAFSPLLPQFIAAHRRDDDGLAARIRKEWADLESETGHIVLPLEVYAHLLGAVQRDMAGEASAVTVPEGITPPAHRAPKQRRRRGSHHAPAPRLRGPDGRWKARGP